MIGVTSFHKPADIGIKLQSKQFHLLRQVHDVIVTIVVLVGDMDVILVVDKNAQDMRI